jgi:murein DD-endopeptidase
MSIARNTMLAVTVVLMGACAAGPERKASGPSETRPGFASDALAGRAADHALAMVGKPYRYAGSTPAGFDCSGLVQYSFSKAGVHLPRDTQAQRRLGRLVDTGDLRRGDLLFFDQEGKKLSHVAIFLGDARFVHAPSSGGKVRTDSLDAAYWRQHFVEARRI